MQKTQLNCEQKAQTKGPVVSNVKLESFTISK